MLPSLCITELHLYGNAAGVHYNNFLRQANGDIKVQQMSLHTHIVCTTEGGRKSEVDCFSVCARTRLCLKGSERVTETVSKVVKRTSHIIRLTTYSCTNAYF